ncbi:response regulator [Verminephrobacter aporrectodeae]|uniref:DNA-binding response regulator n=1 Tax=Verminephrobacter aporrectodeae subsp. tuberculatae TaxID=1110392 RepID=A0ABT3KX42_9BURK|nr:response regulator transcription factor [Verminephrobacter aporrectodeae]MCW5221665.1 DNA-binding response regulator [Verminephrobacter aporrectodeae subsp. tuberculatae]MCW5257979.1 DNA-binding response regulator [Verminephrobacter aporrectodeae subsp. tuberculatae]MCW5290955.1 DNA-binding response regulator [Verminephrobacter aporrectodeae subsp. tuberculatae]MCW5322883.1 DNA-binding response regulator [Verminephrobacter aporrectodeae subsp. tuberculatae]MCW8165568.1 DNA-binding response 
MSQAAIRVMLVDDHALVRMGFRMLLADAQIDVVTEADTGEQACQDYPRVQPDVVVLDLSMPGMGGLEALRRLLAHDPRARVLALSAHEDTVHPRRVLRAGALGYLAKRSAPEALIAAVKAVARGERYIDAGIAQALAAAQIEGDANPAELLSEREFSVFIQLARGMSVAQIAATLNLSISTVGSHLYRVKQKLGATNQAELTWIALRWGLIQV